MAKDKLTESAVKEALPAARQFKLSDGGGLYLLVHSNGSKYWRFDFRFDGKQKSSSLGVWPEVTLAQARLKRNEAKRKISEGVNPIEEKKEKIAIRLEQVQEQGREEQRKAAESEKVSQEWDKRQSLQWTGKRTKDAVNSLKSHVFLDLGEKHISDISKQDVTAILKNIYKDKKELFKIIWDIYPGYPVVHLGVLFIILFVSMDFLSALATTILYFIITVCVTAGFDLWNE
tara:strand:+ start:48 stop:740 length:693 start_codon:yes stop_codon:yes gene_type:complete